MAEERGDCNREMTGFLVAPDCRSEPRWPRWWFIDFPHDGLVSAASLAVNGFARGQTGPDKRTYPGKTIDAEDRSRAFRLSCRSRHISVDRAPSAALYGRRFAVAARRDTG